MLCLACLFCQLLPFPLSVYVFHSSFDIIVFLNYDNLERSYTRSSTPLVMSYILISIVVSVIPIQGTMIRGNHTASLTVQAWKRLHTVDTHTRIIEIMAHDHILVEQTTGFRHPGAER